MVLIKRRVACLQLRRVWRVVDPCLSLQVRVTVCPILFYAFSFFLSIYVNLPMHELHSFMLPSGLENITDNRAYRLMHICAVSRYYKLYRHAIRAMPPTSKTPMYDLCARNNHCGIILRTGLNLYRIKNMAVK